ncbi:DNA polymerase alpha/epsilon subunit B-domain-containing protein [Epithele typhae]|uniref:DNA polymerase alpha/epsilon subunit B-domain-containing protein n=1 Tax=Epithele typhae TaxID=378194 RepID=UPI0020082FBB|nr:DNA polymerase alpha/epsilon subunit B-domain-containing protein [Epithele typhae]KAH9946304.1 DNA polymerase alpha/epsilon subunit B-domain-containing protein [Epithele typhae]
MYVQAVLLPGGRPTSAVPLMRPPTTVVAPPEDASFLIKPSEKSYKHQYANMYFVRLRALRGFVEQQAKRRWNELAGKPKFVPRVLDVERGELCFVIGTVYMEMPLKPNVLDDIARDRSIPAPPPKEKFHSDKDSVMLEDESGRICLVGNRILSTCLVTGVILGALGMETSSGDFEVVDLCFPEMAPQPSAGLAWRTSSSASDSMDTGGTHIPTTLASPDEWIALVSGLEVGSANPTDGQVQILAEYLAGEAGGLDDQSQAARISRLIIAGDALGSMAASTGVLSGEPEKKSVRVKNTQSISMSTNPAQNLAKHLTDVCSSMPVHLLPGASDPAATILPQQPLPRSMFGGASHYATFHCESNPAYICIQRNDSTASTAGPSDASSSKTKSRVDDSATRTLLVHSGQPVDDMFKYVPTPPISRMGLTEATLRWRHMAPTAPDTLWCHPYFAKDPFVMARTPDIYAVGNQPEFATKLVEAEGDPNADDKADRLTKRCRIVLLPKFATSGTLVLVNMRTLSVRRTQFAVERMSAGGGET